MIQLASTREWITTNSELYTKAIEKDNQRVTIEWDKLGDVDGNCPAAIELAIMQGVRSTKLASRYGYELRRPL